MSLDLELDHVVGTFHLGIRLTSAGSVLVLFGASGSGKTLTLKALAGILRPARGRIVLDGEVLLDTGRGIDRSPQGRRLGYVPQNYGLFPHLTVLQNVAFGAGNPRGRTTRERLGELMGRLGLTGLEDHLPGEISGGQQQRVALARALAIEPRLLLLDEPFSALDRLLLEDLREELRSLQEALAIRIVLVTHDLDDVRGLGDEAAFLEKGRVLEHGRVDRLLGQPRTIHVARLTGRDLIHEIRTIARDGRSFLALGGALVPVATGGPARQGRLPVRIEPGALELLDERHGAEDGGEREEGQHVITGTLRRFVAATDRCRLFLSVEGLERDLEAWAPAWWWRRTPRAIGAPVRLGISPGTFHPLEREEPETGRRSHGGSVAQGD